MDWDPNNSQQNAYWWLIPSAFMPLDETRRMSRELQALGERRDFFSIFKRNYCFKTKQKGIYENNDQRRDQIENNGAYNFT